MKTRRQHTTVVIILLTLLMVTFSNAVADTRCDDEGNKRGPCEKTGRYVFSGKSKSDYIRFYAQTVATTDRSELDLKAEETGDKLITHVARTRQDAPSTDLYYWDLPKDGSSHLFLTWYSDESDPEYFWVLIYRAENGNGWGYETSGPDMHFVRTSGHLDWTRLHRKIGAQTITIQFKTVKADGQRIYYLFKCLSKDCNGGW